jgi:hypothetical protein
MNDDDDTKPYSRALEHALADMREGLAFYLSLLPPDHARAVAEHFGIVFSKDDDETA